MPDADPDADLMLRFQGGDETAYAELVRRFQGRIVSLAYRYLGSSADAEDLAQEVFLRIYRARETYEPRARFSTWVHRITVNVSLNLIRGRKVRRHLNAAMPRSDGGDGGAVDFEDAGVVAPGDKVEKDELAQVLREILDGLPERQRIAILLNKYQGLSYEETAEAMEMSLSATKSLLTRARVKIKEQLEPYLTTGRAPERRDSSTRDS